MTASNQTAVRTTRLHADDLKRRLEARQAVTILDARAKRAWDGSDAKIPGAVRVNPSEFRIDPSWPKDRLTVVY